MRMMISSDKDGIQLKGVIEKDLVEEGFMIADKSETPSEDFIASTLVVANDLMSNRGGLGITVGSYGVGSFISAVKVKGMTTVVVLNEHSTYMTREHNNSRTIALESKTIGEELALPIVKEFLRATYAGGRHQVRIDTLNKMT